jgi:toxin FitB
MLGASYISAITIGEIHHGIARLQVGSARRLELTRWLSDVLLPVFRERILPFDIEAATEWGEIVVALKPLGRSIAVPDVQIAATAKAHGLTLATRNTRYFFDLGIDLVDPWVS